MAHIDLEDVKRERIALLDKRTDENFAITSIALSLIDIASNIDFMSNTLEEIMKTLDRIEEN